MIPGDLYPGWRQLPALAWLAAGRFQPRLLDRPILRRAGQAASWPTMLQVLVGARARHTLAAWQTRTLVIVQELPAGQHRPWQGVLAGLACLPLTTAAIIGPFVLLAAVGVWLARYSNTAAAVCILAAAAEFLIQALLMLVQLVSGLATGALPQRRHARRWALRTFDRVAEVTTLAATADDRQAATRLMRPLRRIADRDTIAVLAQPRTPQLAETYRTLGFRPLPIPGAPTMLYRPPGARRAPASRPPHAA